MEKINVAELLKNCPKGMELDCVLYNKVTLLSVDDREDIIYPIRVIREDGNTIALTKYGQYTDADFAKCVIFPKGKTSWEGFQRPFKDGDIVVCGESHINEYVSIFKTYKTLDSFYYHAILTLHTSISQFETDGWDLTTNIRLATEEEKQILFNAITQNGYKWNEETKTLEKKSDDPKFNVGDKITEIGGSRKGVILYIDVDKYHVAVSNTIAIDVFFEDQDNWKLANKFEINCLKPFEDKVLVRNEDNDEWRGQFFSHYDIYNSVRPYVCIGVEGISEYKQCIPFEGNEHLLGSTDDCIDYFKIWE